MNHLFLRYSNTPYNHLIRIRQTVLLSLIKIKHSLNESNFSAIVFGIDGIGSN